MQHDLKSWPEFYAPLDAGMKCFELRRNDRNYQIGDVLHLREWVPETHEYTGRSMYRHVVYVLAATPGNPALEGLAEGYVIMAVRKPHSLSEIPDVDEDLSK